MRNFLIYCCVLSSLAVGSVASAYAEETASTPEYSQHIAPLFRKYCAACHNPEEAEGKLNLESFAALQKGGKRGASLMPGDSGNSRLILMLTGQAKPAMPPEGNEAPTADEIALLKTWIDAGAKGPDGVEPNRKELITPIISPAKELPRAISSMAWSPDGKVVAIARYGEVELLDGEQLKPLRKLADLPGKVNGVTFSADNQFVVTASGVTGLYGQAAIWKVSDGTLVREFDGHRDALFVAKLSPDGQTLATAGYDRKIVLWNADSGKERLTINVHNDAIYDAAFSPDGKILATASGDETIKLWRVEDGQRLDTLSQPLAEQYAVLFSPDSKSIIGAGVDNRIRVWDFVSRQEPQINPLKFARFVHEAPIIRTVLTTDGKYLLTSAEDRTLKLFETEQYTQLHAFPLQPEITPAAIFSPDSKRILVGRLDGSWEAIVFPEIFNAEQPVEQAHVVAAGTSVEAKPFTEVSEQDKNDTPEEGQLVELPVRIKGAIHAKQDATIDVDLYRFSAQAGVPLILEVDAARSKSPLDSKLEVLDLKGNKILRVQLQAVRDSYLTFRGLDSDGRQFRLHNWEEMELNQYLYANGEVVKLWLYPRGPDSGFDMYPEGGSRYTYFDTTPLSHPLGETCYIVEPLAPGTTPVPNGLPVFPIYYENDDDSLRRFGSDSHLTFTAPVDGEYLVRISDVRGSQSAKHKYTLTIRPAQPDFKVKVEQENPEVNAGSGKKFRVRVDRIDGFNGDVSVEITDLPPGFEVTTPLIVQAGHNVAEGTILASVDAQAPEEILAKGSKVTGTAMIAGQKVQHDATNNLGQIKLAEVANMQVTLLPADGDASKNLVIEPGQTISAILRVDRKDFKERITFNPANLPHGVIVDNIGLNGVLIPEGMTERTIFITAAPWVPNQSRPIFFETQQESKPTTQPVTLQVRGKKDETVASKP